MIFDNDIYLEPYKRVITNRYMQLIIKRDEIAGCGKQVCGAINNHLYYGTHKEENFRVFREWAPNATKIYVIGDFNNWERLPNFEMQSVGGGNWELKIALDKVPHGSLFKWLVLWPGGEGERIPAYATRCVQDKNTKIFSAQIWDPPTPYKWKSKFAKKIGNPLIYEVHIGMAGEELAVASFKNFTKNVLPRVVALGYNTIQIMALQEHPYYGSFGYQVSSFFALSSRFGTPEDFKELVDKAHSFGIAVIMDIVHSHAVKNESEGLSYFDGTYTLYFHAGAKGEHSAWGTRCFNYGKDEVIYFLLSNCKYWLEEYNLDGFRFDGITSMLYWDHGLGKCFTDYRDYFNENEDEDALTYLGLANMLVKEIKPTAFTIAEDMSGMPGLAAPISDGGFGFDYRMSMGVADCWIKWIKELPDEKWNVGDMWWQLTNKRADEKTISYAECHDQAMVGDKTIIFRLIDALMYTSMRMDSQNIIVDRGIALHKMIRLITIATAGNGYLTFMGNEFGHPEWIDFPRNGNGWSFNYARRQWSLSDNPFLRYGKLMNFEREMILLFKGSDILSVSPNLLYEQMQSQVVVFERKGFLFVFNFSPIESYTDYKINAPSGKYITVLDTDWKEFNGFERNDRKLSHSTVCDDNESYLQLYLPSRNGYVLKIV
ncbi:MAG: alpha amylase C-terminal domain-containing protein [Bacteroidales bacterium]